MKIIAVYKDTHAAFPMSSKVELYKFYEGLDNASKNTYTGGNSISPAHFTYAFKYDDGTKVGMINLAEVLNIITAEK